MSKTVYELDIDTLTQAVGSGHAAIRLIARLLPAGGPGSKVFPPSHAEGKYAWETRRIENGDVVKTVLLDSVQSQANRMEQALKTAYFEQRLHFPVLAVDFGVCFPEIGEITTLDAPHRIADAIFRDSLLDDAPFPDSAIAKAYRAANNRNATALYRYCPHALLFGVWDSTGSAGGLGNRFQRAIVSEIVGIRAEAGVSTRSRLDPLGIKTVDIYAKPGGGWTTDKTLAKVDKKGDPVKMRPTEVNHSSIPPTLDMNDKGDGFVRGGVTIDHALHTAVLSLPALRRLHFPLDGRTSPEADVAARTVLAALGLAALAHQLQNGYDLRSRCLLFAEQPCAFELLGHDGESRYFKLSPEAADALFAETVLAAERLGLAWQAEKITLRPTPDLCELLRMSREVTDSAGK